MVSNMYRVHSDIMKLMKCVAFTPPYSAIPSYPIIVLPSLKAPFSHSRILGWFCDILNLRPSHFSLHYGFENLKSLSR